MLRGGKDLKRLILKAIAFLKAVWGFTVAVFLALGMWIINPDNNAG